MPFPNSQVDGLYESSISFVAEEKRLGGVAPREESKVFSGFGTAAIVNKDQPEWFRCVFEDALQAPLGPFSLVPNGDHNIAGFGRHFLCVLWNNIQPVIRVGP